MKAVVVCSLTLAATSTAETLVGMAGVAPTPHVPKTCMLLLHYIPLGRDKWLGATEALAQH